MKVLVTGAAGFLGSRVVSQLLDHGHVVRVLLRPASAGAPAEWRGRAKVVHADLRAAPHLAEAFKDIDVLVHLAATVRGSPEAQFAGTVSATERLLHAMCQANSAKHVVLAGSCAVYDWSTARGILNEDTPLEPSLYDRDGYTIAKTWQERVVRRIAEENGWTLTILRPGLIYGPGAVRAGSAGIPLGRHFLVIAPLSRLRLTHVKNCAAAFVEAAEKRVTGTFNIIDDEEVSAWRYVGRLLDADRGAIRLPMPYFLGLAIAHLATFTSRVLFPPSGGKLPGLLRPAHYRARFRPMRYDIRRAKQGLGWKSEPLFETGGDVT